MIVNTGEGKVFQTGLDVAELSRDPDALREQSRRTRDAELAFTAWQLKIWKPVIAAVNGTVAGGGLHFVADADIVIAASTATFLDPHVSVGQVTAYEAIGLIDKMPVEPVMRMALTGRYERMPAQRAYELGMISQIVDPPGGSARRGAGARREGGQELARRDARDEEGALGRGGDGPARRLLRGLAATDRDVGPSRPGRRPARVRREARSQMGRAVTGGERMSYSTYEYLLLERDGPVGWLINNRPDVLNAMNGAMREEFADAWLELDADPEVKVIVHTGEGRAFQTGVDVSELATDGLGMERYRESVEKFDLHFTAWHQHVNKPVITAVNGICAGGGFHWVADADIVIAASNAQFFDPHVSVGQVVAVEAIGLLRKMPFEAVMRMALAGRFERMSAQRAYELGMISQIVDPPEKPARRGPEARRDHRQELAGGDACHQARVVGRAGDGAHRRVPRRRARSSSRCGVTRIRKRARSRSPRSAPMAGPRGASAQRDRS